MGAALLAAPYIQSLLVPEGRGGQRALRFSFGSQLVRMHRSSRAVVLSSVANGCCWGEGLVGDAAICTDALQEVATCVAIPRLRQRASASRGVTGPGQGGAAPGRGVLHQVNGVSGAA
eukprot:2774027-Pyramimonas_sp.AAC.1